MESANITHKILEGVLGDFLSEDIIKRTTEFPQSKEKGDIAFPFFVLAKTLKKAPNKIAEEFLEKIKESPLYIENKENFSEVKVDGPYVNFFVSKKKLFEEICNSAIANSAAANEAAKVPAGDPVIVEFSSPNIAKPFHIGHIRSTVIGSTLANIYEYLGHKVVRMNYLGDYGTQFGKIIVAYRRWGKKEEVEEKPIESLLSYYTKFHTEAEKDESLEEEARKVFYNLENGSEEETKLWKWFKEESLKEFNRVYSLLGIDFDIVSGESFYQKKLEGVGDLLEKNGLLKESDGAMIVDLEEFKMPPALIKKRDGTSLYATRDIAAALDRWEKFHFEKCLYVVASQQNLYFKQWYKITELLKLPFADKIFHIQFGLVSLEGKTLSTRKGDVVFLEDVLLEAIDKTKKIIEEKGTFKGDVEKLAREVGIGAVVFNELSKDRIKDYVFSWDKILNFEGETGPYVQYTYARLCSVLEKSDIKEKEHLKSLGEVKRETIGAERDDIFEILKLSSLFDDVVLKAAKENEPAIITRNLLAISKLANRFYHNNKVLTEDKNRTNYYLAIVIILKDTIKKGLGILGVAAPSKM